MDAVLEPPHYRLLGLVALVGLALCVGAIIVLTFLIPGDGAYNHGGGFLPLPAPSAGR